MKLREAADQYNTSMLMAGVKKKTCACLQVGAGHLDGVQFKGKEKKSSCSLCMSRDQHWLTATEDLNIT
eukprot:scaffold187275_cov19-Tisochrysis_lutea.AAC.1